MSDKVDPDEEIEASRAPLLTHLMELRTRLLTAIAALAVAFIACFFVQDQIFTLLTDPFVAAVHAASNNPNQHDDVIRMVNTDAFGFFITKMKATLFAAIVLSFPLTAWQAYSFVAPGLYKRERAAVLPFLVAAPIMFILGGVFVYYIAMPFALEFALKQQMSIHAAHGTTIQVEYLPKVDEYVGLETTLILAFGIFFQMPVVLSLMARIGVVSAAMLRKTRRYALLGIAAFAALVTPPDIMSMTVMTIPLYLIFEISIFLVWMIEKREAKSHPADAAPTAAE